MDDPAARPTTPPAGWWAEVPVGPSPQPDTVEVVCDDGTAWLLDRTRRTATSTWGDGPAVRYDVVVGDAGDVRLRLTADGDTTLTAVIVSGGPL